MKTEPGDRPHTLIATWRERHGNPVFAVESWGAFAMCADELEAALAAEALLVKPAPQWPMLRDNGKFNRWHEFEKDPETQMCVVCGWAEQVHTAESAGVTPPPPPPVENSTPQSEAAAKRHCLNRARAWKAKYDARWAGQSGEPSEEYCVISDLLWQLDRGGVRLPQAQEPDAIEMELRMGWWLGHGCEHRFFYGDDGEMQCQNVKAHGYLDFKRDSLHTLRERVRESRMKRVAAALMPGAQEPPQEPQR